MGNGCCRIFRVVVQLTFSVDITNRDFSSLRSADHVTTDIGIPSTSPVKPTLYRREVGGPFLAHNFLQFIGRIPKPLPHTLLKCGSIEALMRMGNFVVYFR